MYIRHQTLVQEYTSLGLFCTVTRNRFKMKFTLFLVTMLLAVLAVFAFRSPIDRPRPGTPGFPTFPGHGPFNPKPPQGPWGRPGPRFRREASSHQIEEDEPLYVQQLAESVDG